VRKHIRVLDARGHEIDPRKLRRLSGARAASFTFRQDPGPKNSLGSIRISMPNKEQVYMHDTPKKELFERDYRFLSYGRVRVEGVYDLASWLLRRVGEPLQWAPVALRNEVDAAFRARRLGLYGPAGLPRTERLISAATSMVSTKERSCR
jgi:L,D-transpeptidase YcbB